MTTPVRIFAFAGLAMAAMIGSASAQSKIVVPSPFSALAAGTGYTSSAYADRVAYDHSGSRGRLDIGANPMHPEGPGNFSD
jgi:hypothetical protein